jgi:NHL repeat
MPRYRTLGWLIALFLVAAGCGGGGGGSSSSGNSLSSPPTTVAVAGAGAKGLLLGAIINFYPISNGVASSTSVATTRSDTNSGQYSTSVPITGPALVTLTVDGSSQMLDEISGNTIAAPSGLILHAVVDSPAALASLAITPLTEMAYDLALASPGGLTVTNIDAANSVVGTAFLGGASILTTQPVNLASYAAATAAQQAEAKLLAAFAVAANNGTAVGASNSSCTGVYPASVVCLIGGLGGLLNLGNANTPTYSSAVNYLVAAYASIDAGTVTLLGGKSPAAIGLNVATVAESSFVTAVAKQLPLPGFNSAADPLSNTKALFANVRTNILDQSTTKTFGYAPVLSALTLDTEKNVAPVINGVVDALTSSYIGANLIQLGTTNTGSGSGVPTPNLLNPRGLALDGAGNLYTINGNNTISKVSGSTATVIVGRAGVTGHTDGVGTAATFANPSALAADAAGNIYVADTYNNTVRKISGTTVATLASVPTPGAITVDGSGNVFVASHTGSPLYKISPAGVVTALNPPLTPSCAATGPCYSSSISALAVDSVGNLYVANIGAIQKITPSGQVSLIAGQLGGTFSPATDGTGAAAHFVNPQAMTINSSGTLYLVDDGGSIRRITSAGVVTTLANRLSSRTGQAAGTSAILGDLMGIAIDAIGNVYVADPNYGSIQELTPAGVITTLVHSIALYQNNCGYDPLTLGTANNVALCSIIGTGTQQLLTITQTSAGTYTVKSQALTASVPPANAPYNPITHGWSVVSTTPALQATFNWTTSATGSQSGGFTGPVYINGTGGQVQVAVTAAESSNWNPQTQTGSLTIGGTLSNGSGGITLVSATLGNDSVLNVANVGRLAALPYIPVLSATQQAVSASGTLDIIEFTTNAFSYAAKVVLGAPVMDKSKEASPPGTITLNGSVNQVNGGVRTPVFNGTASVSLLGVPSFDVTQPIGPSNYFTAQVQVAGTVSLTGGRTLEVGATVNDTQVVPTPALPASMTASYSYATPQGSATLNATGQYDSTTGYSGQITNNSGVVVAVTCPIGGSWSGVVTANGTRTATITRSTIYYSDGTSESVY